MQSIRRTGTGAEMALRRALWQRGLRYRVDRRPLPDLRRKADIVFVGARVAVFVDGCFWHVCPEHGNDPTVNESYWTAKLSRNMERDRETDVALTVAGWLPIRVWEHEDPARAAEVIATAVRERA
jgi:DNA mismatch endonuclease (patch repair protein)